MARRENFPWFKFYPDDYLRNTRHMTLEQRGAYMDHIALQMQRGGPLPDDTKWLAHQMHISTRKAAVIVEELIALKKIRRVAEGITNERCEEEISAREHQRKVNTENALNRERFKREPAVSQPRANGEPTVNQTSTDVEISKKQNEINEAIKVSLRKTSTTRARGELDTDKERKSPHTPPKGGSDPLDQAFEDFWRAFPEGRKQAKGDARAVFRKIVLGKHRQGLRAKAETLIAAAARYAASKPDPEFTPMPSTWLNGGRWEDVPAGPVVAAPGDPEPVAGKAWGWWRGLESKFAGLGEQRWRDAIAKAQPNGVWPWWILGAPPGHAECVVPSALVEEFGYREIYQGKIEHV